MYTNNMHLFFCSVGAKHIAIIHTYSLSFAYLVSYTCLYSVLCLYSLLPRVSYSYRKLWSSIPIHMPTYG